MTTKVQLINTENLKKMFILQDELNIKYGGVNWRDGITMGKAKFAVLDEVSEFLRELESEWKWWKVGGNYNRQKALYELIDVVHFAMLITLHKYELSDVLNDINYKTYIKPGAWLLMDGDDIEWFTDSLMDFLAPCNHSDIDEDVSRIANLIQAGGNLLGMTDPQDMFNAYVMKNQRNHSRVDGGLLTGDYDKSKESDIPE